jgi:NAD(P)-dependent dehydrogenase (short-subunit alcohol dehydrogenase family)
LAFQLAPKKIRINAVAPGHIWTPLITVSTPNESVKEFGRDTPLGSIVVVGSKFYGRVG